MNGVDRHDQLQTCYDMTLDVVEKNLGNICSGLYYTAIVNAFIIFESSNRRTRSKKRYTHFDFRCELAHQLIAGFSSRKRKSVEGVNAQNNIQNINGHESVRMNSKRRCKVHASRKERKETVFGCKLCNVNLCRHGRHNTYHNGN